MARKLNRTTDDFISEANIIHNNRYDYSSTSYCGYRERLSIICSIHGIFEITPAGHLSDKRGCPVCSPTKRKTTAEFISGAICVHGTVYDYSRVEYKNSSTLVKIVCKVHGEFLQSPTNHVHDKNGCPSCKTRYIPTTAGFIDKSREVHGNRYNYDKVVYAGSQLKVIINCPIHGDFLKTPQDHITGSGCKKCFGNVSSNEIEWLDSLNIDTIYRQADIDIGGKKIKADAYNPITNTVYEFWGDFWHGNLTIYNSDDINRKNNKTFGELYKETQEKRKLILDSGYNLIEIWEIEFNYEIIKQELIQEIKMANLSQENIARLKLLIRDGVQVLTEVEDLKGGLSDTIKAVAEELEVKPGQLSKLIKICQKGKMNDQREDWDELEELYKSGGLG